MADDTISRQAAIKGLREMAFALYGYDATSVIGCAIYKLQNLPSAQRWIPVSERLPKDLEEVNITWVNHAPEQYYADIKDIPFVASGVYYKGRWYWWSAVCVDYLREYGNSPADAMDDRIEVVAWTPLMEPYREER